VPIYVVVRSTLILGEQLYIFSITYCVGTSVNKDTLKLHRKHSLQLVVQVLMTERDHVESVASASLLASEFVMIETAQTSIRLKAVRVCSSCVMSV